MIDRKRVRELAEWWSQDFSTGIDPGTIQQFLDAAEPLVDAMDVAMREAESPRPASIDDVWDRLQTVLGVVDRLRYEDGKMAIYGFANIVKSKYEDNYEIMKMRIRTRGRPGRERIEVDERLRAIRHVIHRFWSLPTAERNRIATALAPCSKP